MSSGFEVYRSDGKLALSSLFKHYYFVKRIRGQSNFYTDGVFSDNVIVAFANVDSTKENLSSYRFSKGAYNLWGYANAPRPPTGTTLSFYSVMDCYVYIFDTLENQTSESKYGLQVFNKDGVLVFDTSKRFMRVLDVIQTSNDGDSSWSHPYPPDEGLRLQYPSVSNIALVPLKVAIGHDWWSDNEFGDGYYGQTWWSAYSNKLTIKYVEYFEEYDGGGMGQGANYSLEILALVVDVTGLT